jgi:hypothetical protein
MADAIFKCEIQNPCAEILCPLCARRYRLWLTSELLHLTARGPPAFVATILLDAVPGPALRGIEPRILHDRVRQRLKRAGVWVAIGGTEASFDASKNRWIVHLHLLVFGSLERMRPELRDAFRNPDLDRPVLCQPLRNRAAQTSYLQKFLTCHRPGQPDFRGKGRAYPMKQDKIDQLARWTGSKIDLAHQNIARPNLQTLSSSFFQKYSAGATRSVEYRAETSVLNAVDEATAGRSVVWAFALEAKMKEAFADHLTLSTVRSSTNCWHLAIHGPNRTDIF